LDLKLADNVVYAILAAVVLIFLIIYITRIIAIRASLKYDEWAPKELATAAWPAVTQEREK
jgi:succinate dehydrogenase hydrophobic anchor subunit